jgi:hypothetical protein
MSADDDKPPNDLKEFLPSKEDFARVLDGTAAEQRTREAVRKAEKSATFASAIAELKAPLPEAPPKAVQASERVEYKDAKTVPPRTRRDTLELQGRIEVAPALLDPRHRPTERILRVPSVARPERGDGGAPAVEREPAPPSSSRRSLVVLAILLLGAVIAAVVVSRPTTQPQAPERGVVASGPPASAAAPPPPPMVSAPPSTPTADVPSASTTAEEAAPPSAAPTATARSSRPHGGTQHPAKGAEPLPKAVD